MEDLNGSNNNQHFCIKEREIDRLTDKTDSVLEGISEIKVILAVQAELFKGQQSILDEHIRRSEVSEARLDKLELPYVLIAYVLTPLGVICSIAGSIFAAMQYLGLFNK